MHVAIKRFYALEDPLPYLQVSILSEFLSWAFASGPYRPPRDFQNAVLRRLINKFETTADGEVLEMMYSLFGEGEEAGFATYFCGEEFTDPVGMRVREGAAQRQLVVEGSTGFRVWEASRYLASYLVKHPELVKGKRVMELGSGPGFCGLVAAKLGGIVTLTDAHAGVLSLLEESSKHSGALVEALDWEARPVRPTVTDVIIGSDIVYDPRLVEPLVGVLEAIKYDFALICCAVRRLSSLELFESCLHSKGLLFKKLVTDNSAWETIRYDNFFVDDRSDVDLVLYQVSR